MNIVFEPLVESHFTLLLTWLETPHVKDWWDQDVRWTKELIAEKYGAYTKGYKIQDGEAKKLSAYIICDDAKPIGYIQLYNAYEFPREAPLKDLPGSLAAFDIFIGDPDYIGKGIGSKTMQLFLNKYCAPLYEYTFVDPDIKNIAAIKSYTKVGFEKVKLNKDTKEMWMLKKNIRDNNCG